jgi:HD-like signal output (HDOD) protein
MDSVPAELINIEMSLEERLRADRVRVPPYPAVIAKLQAVIANPRSTAADIVTIVASDAAFAAAVLRSANSAAMHGPGEAATVSLDTAVGTIGSRELTQMALAAALGAAATGAGPLAVLRREIWRNALVSSQVAQLLAPRRGISSDLGFLAGLIHDFGAVVVVATLEDIITQRRLTVMPEGIWREIVMRYHVEYGMIVAARWELPDPLVDVIARHHHRDAGRTQPLIGLIATVDHVIEVLDRAPDRSLAALLTVPGLDENERRLVGPAVADATKQMALLEATRPARPMDSAVVAERTPSDGWKLETDVAMRRHRSRGVTLWPDQISVRAPTPVEVNYIVELEVATATGPFKFLGTVRRCEPVAATHEFDVLVRPYAMSAQQNTAWNAMIDEAKKATATAGAAAAVS